MARGAKKAPAPQQQLRERLRGEWEELKQSAKEFERPSDVRSAWQWLSSPPPRIQKDRMDEAMASTRPWTLVYALWIFMFGFSVDDLQVLRIPGYLIAIAGAIFAFSIGSIVQARNLLVENRDVNAGQFELRMQLHTRTGQLALVVTALIGVAWFVVFSNGVPPWAA